MTEDSTNQKISPRSTISATERNGAAVDWREEIRARDRANRIEAGKIWLGGEKPFEEFTFDQFNPDLNNTHRFKTIVQKFDVRKGNLFLLGPVGTGKTHLMTAKALEVFNLGGRVRIFNKKSFAEFLQKNTDWLALLRDLDFIGWDDIDDEPNWKKILTAIKLVIQERDNHRKNGMFITSNKPLATLGEILGGKIQDRMNGLFQNLVIPEDTPSVRGIIKRSGK